jgi:hypothetical protein
VSEIKELRSGGREKIMTSSYLDLNDDGLGARVIGYSGRNGIVNGRIGVVFSRIPFLKFSI